MNPAIQVEGISKSYDISHRTTMKASYGTLKDDVANILKRPFGKHKQEKHETFWALKDVTFDVNQGEIFGVVGKNGSGKSTLLKILARIADPTTGTAKLNGRVASLLEVGTGFHPELTGRENIFFNGSMIGMSRQEIRKRFNEIVEFSEVEKFLDTPVKFYSSGMYVRLAFSVAAHLEPEILLLDEVLSVGDAAFQKKSLNKIIATMRSGCTVLMVSHGAENLLKLCKNGVLLNNGKVKSLGPIDKVLLDYTGLQPSHLDPRSTKLHEVEIHTTKVKNPAKLTIDSSMKAEVEFSINSPLPNCTINFFMEDSAGRFALHNWHELKHPAKIGSQKVEIDVPRLGLKPGGYSTWFRFVSNKKYGEYALDSDREVVDVGGKRDALQSIVDIPAEWHEENLIKN